MLWLHRIFSMWEKSVKVFLLDHQMSVYKENVIVDGLLTLMTGVQV